MRHLRHIDIPRASADAIRHVAERRDDRVGKALGPARGTRTHPRRRAHDARQPRLELTQQPFDIRWFNAGG
jgi:hypothetical protein